MVDPIEMQWEANSQAFAQLIAGKGTPHHAHILNPCVEGLLGDVSGKRLLDAGCGEGYLSRYYAEKGAIVTGVDISSKLIDVCKNHPSQANLGIEYRVGNICELDGMSDNEFDVVLCNLVLLNVPCLDAALRNFFRVIRPGGILVFSVVHPAFNFYGPGAWEMGEKNPITRRREGLFFKTDRYFDEEEYKRYWKTREGERFPEPISFFHRTLSTYVRSLIETGFQFTNVEEPRPVSDDDFFEREQRIPFFLVFRAEKPSLGKT
ncbi:MAG: class I SAM-dependent methyltransferase [Candidatus Thorarchaeota archaeon]|jgi:ubiquinone/menaquinone biosynthesis C-methylase UbiE